MLELQYHLHKQTNLSRVLHVAEQILKVVFQNVPSLRIKRIGHCSPAFGFDRCSMVPSGKTDLSRKSGSIISL
jgi:hypothetical protein